MKILTVSLFLAAILPMTPAAQNAEAPAAPVVAAKARNVGPAEFDTLRQQTNTVVLDVRTPAEFADGHLAGAVLLDFRSPEFARDVAKLDRSKTYLVHCAGGVRSSKACVKMVSLGFTNLVNLEGGLSAWTEAGKPVGK